MKVYLKDGSEFKIEDGISYSELAFNISPSLRKKCLVAEVDGKLVDLSTKVLDGAHVNFITTSDKEAFEVLNHSCAHLLAQAVKRIYPNALFWVGPAIEEGFYYDIDLGDSVLHEEDLAKIEQEMKKISKENVKLNRVILSKKEDLIEVTEKEWNEELKRRALIIRERYIHEKT